MADDDEECPNFYNFAKLQEIYHERIHSREDGAVTPMKGIREKNFNLFSPDINNFQEMTDCSKPSSSIDGHGRLIYEGSLFYKNYNKKSSSASSIDNRNWKQFWAVLRKNNKLYLYKERPMNLPYDLNLSSTDDDENCTTTIDVQSSIADVAYDYAKFYKSVFRVVTQNQIEHLFKAENIDNMIRWLENLQHSNNLNENPNGLSNSMALIIKRYESHSLSVSPTSAKSTTKKNGFFKNSTSSSSSGGKDSPTIPSVCSPANHQNGTASSTSSAEKPHEITPVVKHKKWRKSRKTNSNGSCSPSTPRAIHPDAVFGQPLDKCPTGESDFVPLIVQLCIKVVERHGLLVVGVYRIPGNTANVNSLILSLDKGFENADFSDQRWRDVNVVSSLVKAFFRKLPDSLLTDKLYQSFIDSNRIENHSERLKKLKYLIEKLPKSNYETLKFLTRHLSKVVAHSHINKMQARNLALMFGPSLLRSTNDSMATMVYHMSDQCQLVESLILYCDWIFCSSTAGDSQVPPPVAGNATPVGRTNNSSFADVNRVLNEIKKNEDELTETKDDAKNVWRYRRNSRKSSKKICSPLSVLNESCGSTTPPTKPACEAKYQERNIDDEIESRRKICENMFSIEQNLNKSNRVEVSRVADEVRKNRQKNIYAARRIFIGDESSQPADLETLAKMDCLLKHSRHLNVNPHSLDVFSEETREKIRRFQTDNQLLMHKNHRSQRSKNDRAFEKFRLDSKNDRFVDDQTPNRCSSDVFTCCDDSSVTSDYSTTSSNMNGYDAVQSMSNGFSSKFAVRTSSDYSSNASPVTPHCEKISLLNDLHKIRPDKKYYFAEPTPVDRRSRPFFDRTREDTVPWYRDEPPVFDSTDSVDMNGNKKCIVDPFSDRKFVPFDPNRAKNGFKPKIRSQSTSTDQRRKSFSVSSSTTDGPKPSMYRSDSTNFFNKIDESKNRPKFVQRKPSKTRKLKIWFKESFRRSSPDLATPTDDDGEIVTKV